MSNSAWRKGAATLFLTILILARLPVTFSHAQISDAIRDLITANGQTSCYIRPLVFRGYAIVFAANITLFTLGYAVFESRDLKS